MPCTERWLCYWWGMRCGCCSYAEKEPFVCATWREMNIAVKKDFPRQGLTLTVRINDLLLSSDWSSEQLGMEDGCTNRTFGNDRAHMLTVGLTWKFGTMLDMHPVEDEPELTATLRKNRRGRH